MGNETVEARVLKRSGQLYVAATDEETFHCTVRQTVKENAEYKVSPVVAGDVVLIEPDESPPADGMVRNAVITEVFPRKTLFIKRKAGIRQEQTQVIVANIDQMIVVASVRSPSFKLRLIDRFLISAIQGGLKPVVVINKIDLKHDIDLDRTRKIYRSIGIRVLTVSAETGDNIDSLRETLRGKESVFVGQSGVGKSSLLNAVQTGLSLRIGDVSGKTGKGKHTTTVVELFKLDFGGYVVDTPGLRALGLTRIERKDIDKFYSEIAEISAECKFNNCSHRSEPECAVKRAVGSGAIYGERYESYLRILEDFD